MKCPGKLAILLLLVGLATVPAIVHAQDTAKVTLLDQGWSAEDRLQFYYTSQGSAAIPRDVFVNLEAADGTDLFGSDRVTASYGLIPQAADPKYNPDGLPIGVTITKIANGRWQGEWVGVTCAVCHTGELHTSNATIRIDGGVNAQFDIAAFATGLADALTATADHPDKFDRLAARLARTDAASKAELMAQLKAMAIDVRNYANQSLLGLISAGPGRIDAFGAIANRITGDLMHLPQNWSPLLAPTKIPFLWNAPQSSWVQWSGTVADPLTRNVAEALGVYAKQDLYSSSPGDGLFQTTVDLQGIIRIEQLLRRLAPPKWPQSLLGALDEEKVSEGRRLFTEICASCHTMWPYRWSGAKLDGKRFIENALVPVAMIGTDPMQFHSPQFNPYPSRITGVLADYLDEPYKGSKVAPFRSIGALANRTALSDKLAQLDLTQQQLIDANGFRNPAEKGPTQAVYKAAPRDGVWATPPFLHNGSVPSLYELLLPAASRSKSFFLGRNFDPVKVGIDTSGDSGKRLFDTTRLGNSNAGHSFEDGPLGNGIVGRSLSEAERWEIIEYLKSIPVAAGQVAPFGGPAAPIEAWKDPTFFHVRSKTGYTGDDQ